MSFKIYFKVAVETPETEQPPSLRQSESSEEQASNTTVNREQPTPSPASIPAPGPSSAPAPVPTPRSGPGEILIKGTPERISLGGNSDTISPYINGGIINKRASDAGSMASESMDMSLHKESVSMYARVSQHASKTSSVVIR